METAVISMVLIPVYVSLIFIPYWTRRTESFGVSIPERVYKDERLLNMRKAYAIRTGILSILHWVFVVFLMGRMEVSEEAWSIWFTVLLFGFLIVAFFLYYMFHRRMKELKTQENWMKDTQTVTADLSFRDRKLTYSSWWFLVPFLISAATVLFTIRMYSSMPAELPMQYGLDREVTQWAEKSYRSALMLPIVQLYMTGIFFFVHMVIGRAKQQTSAENPEKSLQQQVIFRRRWSLFTIVSSVILTLVFVVPQVSFVYDLPVTFMMIVPFLAALIIVVGAIVLSATTGQGGSRVTNVSGKNEEILDRDDDQYWKLGQIYFNPNDPSIFLEKRFGVGWTVNFARPMSWVFLLGIIGIAILLPVLLG
ncbi:DUF1648 domain-containing protein [Salimicrobium flavidum]|uniref:Uncharacterized membrane protein n=1 Tax=Salimicrobium flavidum TaxID=570947 RepID=A0A1N7ITH1_9BACI|nr:DUF5808 domain-containing protein [Salimicrobium flavidum]SIS40374.1 Uncharacterized membrane protein [Salimicrobium flavidum]